MPITSYPPEFLEIFKTASQKPITITLPSAKFATRLRFRLYSLRKELRKESHPLAPIANSVEFIITDKHLTCRPVDCDLLPFVQEAGIIIEPFVPPTETDEGIEASAIADQSTLADLAMRRLLQEDEEL